MNKIIFQNSKCIIRTIESYGDEFFSIPDDIKHVTCGIVPSIMNSENIEGVLFLTLCGSAYYKPMRGGNYFIDESDVVTRSIEIMNLENIPVTKEYVEDLIDALLRYNECRGPSELTYKQIEDRAKELAEKFELYV